MCIRDRCLLAYIIFRDQIIIGFCDFQIISEDFIVADFQIFDAGSFPFAAFQSGDPVLGVGDRVFQLVQLA